MTVVIFGYTYTKHRNIMGNRVAILYNKKTAEISQHHINSVSTRACLLLNFLLAVVTWI
jgi:hypothetical protein